MFGEQTFTQLRTGLRKGVICKSKKLYVHTHKHTFNVLHSLYKKYGCYLIVLISS